MAAALLQVKSRHDRFGRRKYRSYFLLYQLLKKLWTRIQDILYELGIFDRLLSTQTGLFTQSFKCQFRPIFRSFRAWLWSYPGMFYVRKRGLSRLVLKHFERLFKQVLAVD